MTAVWFVGLAGIGAITRWLLGSYLNDEVPLGTFTANVVASLAIGYLSASGTGSALLLQTALLGALSTWSSLAAEVSKLMRASRNRLATLYLGMTLVSGVAAAWLGILLGR